MTDSPKSILQNAGCGLVNGPFGNAKTETIKKKNITQSIPAHKLSSIFPSSLKIKRKKKKWHFVKKKKVEVMLTQPKFN